MVMQNLGSFYRIGSYSQLSLKQPPLVQEKVVMLKGGGHLREINQENKVKTAWFHYSNYCITIDCLSN